MDQDSLVMKRIDAGNEFLREFERFMPVVAAYWKKEPEFDRWNLYIATDRLENGMKREANGEVVRITSLLNDPHLDPFRVHLVGLTDAGVQAVLRYYLTHPPKIPVHFRDKNIGGIEFDEVYLIHGPTGEYTMPSGREALNQIIDQEASFFQQHGRAPRKVKLPVLLAYDLSKCGRNELGDLSGKVFMEGITAFEKEGFHGMRVEIVRDRNASLEFE